MKCCDAEMSTGTYQVKVVVGGHEFCRDVSGSTCAKCGSRRLVGPELVRLDVWVARELATRAARWPQPLAPGSAVVPTAEILTFMRKAIGMSRVALAALLGTTAERVTRWECGDAEIGGRLFADLCSLVSGNKWTPDAGRSVPTAEWASHPLIAVEGGDAAGKATLVAGLVDWLVDTGGWVCARSLSFPDYSTPTGKLILAHLRGEWSVGEEQTQKWGSDSDALVRQSLMTVNRLESMPCLRAALRRGPVVLDRWVGSSLAYGGAEGLDQGWVDRISDGLVKPDLYLWLDVDPEVARARRPARDANEADVELQHRVRQRYSELSGRPDWVRLDASRPAAAVLVDATFALTAKFPHLRK